MLRGRAAAAYAVAVRGGAAEVAAALTAAPWVVGATAEDETRVRVEVTSYDAAEVGLVPLLAALGRPVVSVAPHAETLERVFLEVTK